MKTWIARLRGITPTGRNKVPMAPRRRALEAAGFKINDHFMPWNAHAD